MANVLIEENILYGWANHLRGKLGIKDKMKPATMLEKTKELGAEVMAVYQEKNVIPTTNDQEITADEGYSALSKVTVAGDPNLIPENIPEGISIFGVVGNRTGGSTQKTILSEQQIHIAYESYFQSYMWSTDANAALCTLVDGEEYSVVFDGIEYTCTAEPMAFGALSGIGIGNRILVTGENTGEPFIFAYMPDYEQNACMSLANEEATHTIAIYQESLSLPEVTVDNNGEYFHSQVVNGKWVAVDIPDGSGVAW